MFVHKLNTLGYKGELLSASIKERKVNFESLVTAFHSIERIEALMNAKTHGEKSYISGGDHATSDDVFKAAELSNRKQQIDQMEKEKKIRMSDEEKEAAAFRIIHSEKQISVDWY